MFGRHLHVVLPVGISFYTFQSISYIVDVYRGEVEPAKNPIHFALFVPSSCSLFSQAMRSFVDDGPFFLTSAIHSSTSRPLFSFNVSSQFRTIATPG